MNDSLYGFPDKIPAPWWVWGGLGIAAFGLSFYVTWKRKKMR